MTNHRSNRNYPISNLKGQPGFPQYDDMSKCDVSMVGGIWALAYALWGSPIQNKLPIERATNNWDSNHPTDFDVFFRQLGDLVVCARNAAGGMAEGKLNQLRSILDMMKLISTEVKLIRSSEFHQNIYLGKDLRERFPDINVQTTKVTNPGTFHFFFPPHLDFPAHFWSCATCQGADPPRLAPNRLPSPNLGRGAFGKYPGGPPDTDCPEGLSSWGKRPDVEAGGHRPLQ